MGLCAKTIICVICPRQGVPVPQSWASTIWFLLSFCAEWMLACKLYYLHTGENSREEQWALFGIHLLECWSASWSAAAACKTFALCYNSKLLWQNFKSETLRFLHNSCSTWVVVGHCKRGFELQSSRSRKASLESSKSKDGSQSTQRGTCMNLFSIWHM